MTTETENYAELPDAIVERLRAREQRLAMLTPAADRALAAAVRKQFAPRRLRPAAGRRWQYPAAVAAAIALVALVIVRPQQPAEIEAGFLANEVAASRPANDVDGSGRVDILDAFALARARNSDPNLVSQERIDELADRIVSLGSAGTVL
jgi:hypothetical protein